MLRLSLPLLLLLAGSLASARAAERPLLLVGDIDVGAADALRRDAPGRGLEPVSVPAGEEPTAEQAVAAARPLYRDMAFGRAVQRLAADEATLLRDRLPSPALLRALAELEIWMGACLLLDGHGGDAGEHLALARRLDPSVQPDPIFPPEVGAALARATAAAHAPALAVTPRLAPAGARLWLDGVPAEGEVTATPGLHYVVVERADRRPFARVQRLVRAAPEIAVNLAEPAAPSLALAQLAARVARGPAGAEEALAAARLLGRPLVLVTRVEPAAGAGTEAAPQTAIERVDPGDAARPIAHADVPGLAPTVTDVCRLEGACAPVAAVTLERAPAPPPRKPWYKRAAFWAPVGAGVVLIVGGGIALGLLTHGTSDYVVRIH